VAVKDKDRFVVQNQERGGWDVVKKDAVRASAHFETQADAIARAKEIVKKSLRGQGEVRIQGRSGKFRDSDSGSRNETRARDTKH
jgi:hypothetical protein